MATPWGAFDRAPIVQRSLPVSGLECTERPTNRMVPGGQRYASPELDFHDHERGDATEKVSPLGWIS